MPTPHARATIITPPDTEAVIEELMQVTGRHKSAVLKEALDLGLAAMRDNNGLTSSKRLVAMTKDELAALMDDWLKKALVNSREQ